MIALCTASLKIENWTGSFAMLTSEGVLVDGGRRIRIGRLRLEQREGLGKKQPEQWLTAVIWPALIDCSLELLDKAPRGSNSTRIWHREMDRSMANSMM